MSAQNPRAPDGNKKAPFEFRSRRVDPRTQRVVEFMPSNPPARGEVVLVDGVRSRVTRCKVAWIDRRWTIRSLRVKEAS